MSGNPFRIMTRYKSTSTRVSAYLDPRSPILGDCSLAFEAHPSFNNFDSLQLSPGNLPHALFKGKLRILFRWDTSTDGSAVNRFQQFGFYFMSSTAQLNTTGNLYKCVVIQNGTGADAGNRVCLYKKTGNGGFAGSETNLARSASGVFVNGTIYGLEVTWDSLTTPSQVAMTVKIGTATDYSDLASLLTYTDTSSPYTTTVGEGLFFQYSNTGSMLVRLDNYQVSRT